ncbi:tetratricopeptide repeat protein [Hymenobacter latericus]|uniref:tetratricopeptide repeat protein n=1 Tax=Hymenobacter sp. YIM 151858-1 TaxID=2987688 RepID=UPI0022269E70|nr:tetratricopeptide repeat protein [Hymenobacter sp. YIM 151858-1]UYZ58308.1 tetratricopeptide repeat protein [Hymenobacter sp. YIM 151858-1]
MRVFLLGAVLVLLGAGPLRAQTEAAVLARAEALIGQKKYESAYRALEQFDPKNAHVAVVLKKEAIALNYYLLSLNLEVFGLRDLGPGEQVAQLRGKPGKYGSYQLPVAQVLGALKRRHPTDYRLDLGLGHYYYTLQQCGCGRQRFADDELLQKAQQYYAAAHAHQQEDYESRFATGFMLLREKQLAAAVPELERSVALNAQYPNAHYNLAYAYAALGRPAEALPHARQAAALYQVAEYKADAEGMAAALEQQLQGGPAPNLPGTREQASAAADTYAALREQVAAAVAGKAPNVRELTLKLFRLDPDNDAMYADLMDIYQAHNQFPALEVFFREQLPTAPQTPTAQGMLHFYVAILNMQLGRPAAAYPHFQQADTHLRQVAQADNPLFDTIRRGLAESKPRR